MSVDICFSLWCSVSYFTSCEFVFPSSILGCARKKSTVSKTKFSVSSPAGDSCTPSRLETYSDSAVIFPGTSSKSKLLFLLPCGAISTTFSTGKELSGKEMDFVISVNACSFTRDFTPAEPSVTSGKLPGKEEARVWLKLEVFEAVFEVGVSCFTVETLGGKSFPSVTLFSGRLSSSSMATIAAFRFFFFFFFFFSVLDSSVEIEVNRSVDQSAICWSVSRSVNWSVSEFIHQ